MIIAHINSVPYAATSASRFRNKAFREALGTTVTKEIAATRIIEAKRLLHNKLLPISEVAK
jgi:AraC-like DNA-binding protein